MESNGITLLVVDDEALNRDMLSRRLKREGFEALVASNGREALEMMDAFKVDMVLLDVMMPEMNGVETLKCIRQKHSSAELPVVMVSAAGEAAQIVEALNAGANDYVNKPVNMPVLMARMQSQLARRQEARPFKAEVGAKLGVYRLDEQLGKGGVSRVFRATDTRLKREVAVKVMLPEYASSEEQAARFVREAKSLAKLNHKGIVQIYEVGTTPCHFIAMELLMGIDLEKFMRENRLSLKVAVDFAVQIAQALEAVHAHGIFHRDLKPSNLIVDDNSRLHLMDFGVAKVENSEVNLTKPGMLLGTPQYMAPEQIDDNVGPVSARTDLYALGLIFYEMLTGRPAMKGDSVPALLYEAVSRTPEAPSLVVPYVPPFADAICLKLQAHNPDDRYQSASEVVADLEQLYDNINC